MLAKTLVVLCTCVYAILALVIDLTLSKDEQTHLVDDPEVTHKLTFQVSRKSDSGTEVVGDLVVGLFGKTVPRTVENFVELSTMEKGFGYKNSIFHRIIHDFMIQGGDFERADGSGGYSIYNKGKFPDENFTLKHNKKGRVSMANSGKDTNGAQFFILTGDLSSHLDGRHVVFGQLVLGFDVLETLNNAKTGPHDRPVAEVLFNLHGIQLLPAAKELQKEVKPAEDFEGSSGDIVTDKAVQSSSTESRKVPFLVWVAGFSFAGYYVMRWTRRRLGITITGFRS